LVIAVMSSSQATPVETHGSDDRKLVAIAVPLSNRVDLTPDEQISLNQYGA